MVALLQQLAGNKIFGPKKFSKVVIIFPTPLSTLFRGVVNNVLRNFAVVLLNIGIRCR